MIPKMSIINTGKFIYKGGKAVFLPNIMNIVVNTILKRESCRNYLNEPVGEINLNTILTCAQYAPSGSNNQTNHFYVIENKKVLDELENIIKEEFLKMEAQNEYSAVQDAIRKARYGSQHYFYNAPSLIVVTNLKDYPNAMADAVCAVENMMIAATSLNLGSCYINQLHWLTENERVRAFLKLPENETICASLVVGRPKVPFIPKTRRIFGNPITYIE